MNEIIKKNGLKYGIISGLIAVAVTLGVYLIDYKMFASGGVGIISLIAGATVSILMFINTKKQLNGVLSFKEGFTLYFFYAINSIAIATLFNILLYNVIDPELKVKVTEIIIEKTVEAMKAFGGDNNMLKEMISKLKSEDNFSVVNQALGSIYTLLFSSIWGLILAAIFKSKTNDNPFKA